MIGHADLSRFAALVYGSGLVVRFKLATFLAPIDGHSQEPALFDRDGAESLILSSYSKLS